MGEARWENWSRIILAEMLPVPAMYNFEETLIDANSMPLARDSHVPKLSIIYIYIYIYFSFSYDRI